MKNPWRSAQIEVDRPSERAPVPIVGDAAIATRGVGEGRMIPLVIVDTTTRPDIDEMVIAHKTSLPGDARSVWGKPRRWSDDVLLLLQFERPVRCTIVLEFETARQGILVDQTVRSQAIYIQPGRAGDRLKNTMDNPRVLVEVPSADFAPEWDGIFLKAVQKELRKRGLQKSKAKTAAAEAIQLMRNVGSMRMKPA